MLNSTITKSLKKKKTFIASLGFDKKLSRNQREEKILLTAFVHKSYASDFVPALTHNERLEFLGDSILGACVSSLLYTNHPERPESQMTLYKIALVREETLARVARDIDLGDQLFLSHGEEKQGGRDKDAILADGLEALIGATYLLFGYKYSYYFITHYIGKYLEDFVEKGGKSYKSRIQERAQGNGYNLPDYQTDAFKKDSETLFKATLSINGKEQGIGIGKNKKRAQEEAAKKAYLKLQKKTNKQEK